MNLQMMILAGILISSNASAGGNHTHGPGGHTHGAQAPISESQAKARSVEEIDRLIKKEKLESSWSKAEFVSVEKKTTKGKEEWLVIYKNTASEKKDLYIFLSLSGKFVAANHTGK